MLGKGGGFQSWSSFNESLSSLLKKSPTHSHLQEARRLHALMLVGSILNPDSNIAGQASLLGSRLVQAYAQLGCLDEALLAFGRLHCVDNIACNAILRAYVDSAHFSQAIHFFNHLVFKLGFIPDNYTCPLILKACSELCALEEGRKTHDLIRSAEVHYYFKPNVYTKCALIDMFAKCGSLDEARMVFDDMPQKERDLASWTAMICGTIHQGHGQEALCLFNTMRLEGTDPDSVVMAAILPACGDWEPRQEGMALQGCALKSGFHCDLFVSNAVMDMYCKFGDTHQAYSVFCSMPCKDVVSWSTLIAGYSQNCEYKRSLELYVEMINLGVKPSAIIVASILPTIGKLNLSEQGKVMHGFILKQGFDSDVVVSCALMEMYSSCGLAGELEVLLSLWSDWDIMIWNSAIAGHAACENFDLALSVFRKIWKSKCKPNSITLVSILPICTKWGHLNRVWKFTAMRLEAVLSELFQSAIHLSICTDLGMEQLSSCNNCLRQPDGNVLGCLLAACRVHNMVEPAYLLAKEILQDKLEDSGYHILLSNMYASTKKWEDASRVRVLIKEKGLRKKPGKSWIQIGNCTHIFDARGTTHSEFNKIQVFLETLMSEMKEPCVVDPCFSLPSL
ncbi:UNVERIFIED_CONTAM: Pentatricopeptide repeat-containing protein [Sesamum radiatum]|uniref:Pentatricopeptide repeat-containing protein n=1 Tax=Sesamum radiatum TaxID=300843 RepID=A0AAW2W4A9_SESRA